MADSQQFLRDLDKKLWSAADRLRANLDAAVYSRAERDSLPQAARRVDAEASSNHAVLGLIFLKYVSDSFAIRQREIEAQLRDPKSDYFLDPADYGGEGTADYLAAIRAELEERDYYIEKNVFWVPALARWKTLQESAKLPPGTEIEIFPGRVGILPAATGVPPVATYKITSTGKLIDDALDAVEKENPNRAERDRLPKAARRVRAAARINRKNVIDKRYAQLQLPAESLIGLINLIATIPFEHADLHAKDILGHVYEYFLGQFALAEGKKGGQYFTPKSIVSLIVEMLEPYQGRVYDPAMGSGGFFVQSAKFVSKYGGTALRGSASQKGAATLRSLSAAKDNLGNLSVYGQDKSARRKRRFGLSQRARRASTRRRARQSNPTTWRLAAMNMAIRGIDFTAQRGSASSQREAIPQSVSAAKDHFGKEPANSFTSDQHPDLRADYVMANPPFNISEWWDAKLEDDPRWRYGTPPTLDQAQI